MCSTREEITEAFASLATALSRVLGLTFDALTTPERLALLEHCETARRQLPSVEHTLINRSANNPPRRSWAASWD